MPAAAPLAGGLGGDPDRDLGGGARSSIRRERNRETRFARVELQHHPLGSARAEMVHGGEVAPEGPGFEDVDRELAEIGVRDVDLVGGARESNSLRIAQRRAGRSAGAERHLQRKCRRRAIDPAVAEELVPSDGAEIDRLHLQHPPRVLVVDEPVAADVLRIREEVQRGGSAHVCRRLGGSARKAVASTRDGGEHVDARRGQLESVADGRKEARRVRRVDRRHRDHRVVAGGILDGASSGQAVPARRHEQDARRVGAVAGIAQRLDVRALDAHVDDFDAVSHRELDSRDDPVRRAEARAIEHLHREQIDLGGDADGPDAIPLRRDDAGHLRAVAVEAVVEGIGVVEHEVPAADVISIEIFVVVIDPGIENRDPDARASVPAGVRDLGADVSDAPGILVLDAERGSRGRAIDRVLLDVGDPVVPLQPRDLGLGEARRHGRNQLVGALDHAPGAADQRLLGRARPLLEADDHRPVHGRREPGREERDAQRENRKQPLHGRQLSPHARSAHSAGEGAW